VKEENPDEKNEPLLRGERKNATCEGQNVKKESQEWIYQRVEKATEGV